MVNYDAEEIEKIKGKASSQYAEVGSVFCQPLCSPADALSMRHRADRLRCALFIVLCAQALGYSGLPEVVARTNLVSVSTVSFPLLV